MHQEDSLTPFTMSDETASRRAGEASHSSEDDNLFIDFLDSYLALVPRGLELVACEWLRDKLSPHWRVETSLLEESDAGNKHDWTERLPKRRRNDLLVSQCCRQPVGTIPQQPHDVSFGYRGDDHHSTDVSTTGGRQQGMVWLHLQTNAPHRLVASLRVLGPILSTAGFFAVDLSDRSAQSLSTIPNKLSRQVNKGYNDSFLKALKLWKDFALASWDMTCKERDKFHAKVSGITAESKSLEDPLLYRLSCVRTDSKRYKYSRSDFLATVADCILPAAASPQQWKVNLTKYDVSVARWW